MKAQRRAISLSIAAITFLAAACSKQDAKAIKKTIRAADGVKLVCEVRGKGDTSLIFLHGLCGERAYWKNQADVFAADYRIVTLDQAGHGESGKDRKEWTIDSLAGDVESVCKELGIKRVILVGQSMGGPVALWPPSACRAKSSPSSASIRCRTPNSRCRKRPPRSCWTRSPPISRARCAAVSPICCTTRPIRS